MSGRGRRRRRRKGAGSGTPREAQRATPQQQPQPQAAGEQGAGAAPRRARRRRGRGRGQPREAASPASSEDLVRSLPRERPESLTAAPDGTTLEQVVGELQSEYGVPTYPQEYRITLKVADERDATRTERTVAPDAALREAAEADRAPALEGTPRREKAPSMRTDGSPTRGRRRRGGRRRRRRGGGNGATGTAPS